MDRVGLRRRIVALFAAALGLTFAAPAYSQQLSVDLTKTGSRFRSAFSAVASEGRQSVVRVLADGEPVALGVVVSSDGHVLTKGSQLRGEVRLKLPDGSEVDARTVAVHGPSDLALLRCEATGLTPAAWADAEPSVGAWLVSVGEKEAPIGVGVVSVAGRSIAPRRGVLGIVLSDEGADGPTVARVFPESGAAEAGLRAGDVIRSVAGETVPNRDALISRLATYRPGDTLPLLVRRGESEEEVKATLGNEWSAMMDRQARQNLMGGKLSVRSSGFERVVQHDTVLKPEDCGGPVVDLSGRVVGINIARAGRVESYALPATTVRGILEKLLAQDDLAKK